MIKRKTIYGFTLMELMITVTIISVIAAIAIPSYQEYVYKTRRVDSKNALLRIQAEQEKYYLENNTYFNNAYLCGQSWFPDCPITENGYYTLAVTGANLTETFVATATPVTGKGQENDTKCTAFSIDGSGQRTATGSDPASCWK